MAVKPKTDSAKALWENKLKSMGVPDSCIKKSASDHVPKTFISTGVPEIDAILGEGRGIPTGTVLELAGESQSGKTYLLLKMIASAQKASDKMCAFLDIENTFFAPRAVQLGVDLSRLVVIDNLELGETYADVLMALIDSAEFSVVGVDSISALTPTEEYQKNAADKSTIGLHARFIKRTVKKALQKCSKTDTILVLINQIYMGSGKMPNTFSLTASGGLVMNYMPHMRLWFTQVTGADGAILNAIGDVIGGKSIVTLQKTRYGTPKLKAPFPIMFCDEEADALAAFLMRGRSKKYAYFEYTQKKGYRYVHPDLGILCEDVNPIEFLKLLMETPAPAKRTRGDNSTNVFEYIVGRMKTSDEEVETLMAKIARQAEGEILPPPVFDVEEPDDDGDEE